MNFINSSLDPIFNIFDLMLWDISSKTEKSRYEKISFLWKDINKEI